jgi:hypothetical protein
MGSNSRRFAVAQVVIRVIELGLEVVCNRILVPTTEQLANACRLPSASVRSPKTNWVQRQPRARRCQLERERAAVLVERGFRHAVGARADLGALAMNGGDMDDAATRLHERCASARQEDGAVDHRIEWDAPLRQRRIDRRRAAEDTGAVDERVEAVPSASEFGQQRPDRRQGAVVRRERPVVAGMKPAPHLRAATPSYRNQPPGLLRFTCSLKQGGPAGS